MTSRTDRSPTIAWTYHMQVALHLISTEFNLVGHNRADLFNKVFAEELVTRGIQDGARVNVLNAQYNMRTRPDKAKIWLTICAEPTTQEEVSLREGLRQRIRQALQKGDEPGTPRKVRKVSSPSVPEGDEVVAIVRQLQLTPSSRISRPAPVQSDALSSATLSPRQRQTLPKQDAYPVVEPSIARTSHHSRNAASPPSRRPASALIPVINRSESMQQAMLPSPPTSSRKVQKRSAISKQRIPKKKIEYWRNDGSRPQMSKNKQAGLEQGLVGIPQDVAHPPSTGLLFRYWSESDEPDHNSKESFIARKYFRSNVVHFRPPKSSDVDLTDVFNHMNRNLKETPFVSTCNRLLWIFRLATSEMAKGVENGRITIINPTKLDKRAVFWARPFHDELTKKEAPWTNGAERYKGTYEFLVWGTIHKDAIITTVKVQDLVRLVQSSPAVGYVLRINILSDRSALSKKELVFLQQKVPLNTFSVKAIAELARFMGLDKASPIEHISHIVADVIQGWHLHVVRRDEQEWRALATLFARTFSSGTPSGLLQEQTIRMAFLEGVQFGRGDFNARHKPETVVIMTKRAKLIGLESPARIITNELDAIKIMAWSQEQRVTNLLKSRKEQLMLEAGFEKSSEDDEDDGDVMMLDEEPPIAGPLRPRTTPAQPNWSWTRRMIRHDEDDAGSDFGGAFEFDAAGRVV
ncbi:hypothetical protein BST61_g10521 [Cercospora zeina]